MKARSSKSQDELGDALRELPRAEASIGFRRRVLNRLEEERLRRVVWRPVYVAVIALIVTLIPVGVLVKESRDQARSRQRVEQLREEYRSLEQEMLDLQSLAMRSTPLVGVQGAGDYDFVLDLRNLYADPETGPRSSPLDSPLARPVSYRPTP